VLTQIAPAVFWRSIYKPSLAGRRWRLYFGVTRPLFGRLEQSLPADGRAILRHLDAARFNKEAAALMRSFRIPRAARAFMFAADPALFSNGVHYCTQSILRRCSGFWGWANLAESRRGKSYWPGLSNIPK
jgi:hypothetical protein